MINHKSFFERLQAIFTKAKLQHGQRRIFAALGTLHTAIHAMNLHAQRTKAPPPELIKLERDVYCEAFNILNGMMRADEIFNCDDNKKAGESWLKSERKNWTEF